MRLADRPVPARPRSVRQGIRSAHRIDLRPERRIPIDGIEGLRPLECFASWWMSRIARATGPAPGCQSAWSHLRKPGHTSGVLVGTTPAWPQTPAIGVIRRQMIEFKRWSPDQNHCRVLRIINRRPWRSQSSRHRRLWLLRRQFPSLQAERPSLPQMLFKSVPTFFTDGGGPAASRAIKPSGHGS